MIIKGFPTYLSSLMVLFFISFPIASCSKNGGNSKGQGNHPPTAILVADLIQVNPFQYKFSVDALDQDLDVLTYSWDFGNGTSRIGKAVEVISYEPGREYKVKVKISDGKNDPVEIGTTIETSHVPVTINLVNKFQLIEGFGGFGAMKEYWSVAPFTSDEFVNTLINDLGVTILRDNLPTSFESENDNDDPNLTDFSKINLASKPSGHDESVNDHLDHLRKMKAAGIQKLIVSVWSPATWMKHNNRVGNGTQNTNSAPAYTNQPNASTNQLKNEMKEEFAERCVAYIKTIKKETGLDIYALSIQNEPRFSQFYASCVYDGPALKDLLIVVGNRFKKEGIQTKLFLPEDVGWLAGVESMTIPTLNDPESRAFADIIAVHGYDLDGIKAASTSAQTWSTMYGWGAAYGKQLWMTETSGYDNTFSGAMDLAKAMYTALRYGNVSAWIFWSLSTTNLDAYSLMSSSGEKSKRYFVSRNFYKYIRPGSRRAEASASEESSVFPLVFTNDLEKSTSIILINDSERGRPVKLEGLQLPSSFRIIITSKDVNSQETGSANSSDMILLPAKSVVTLYHQ